MREELDIRLEEQSVLESFGYVCKSENKTNSKIIQNTTVLMGVNETTFFGLLGHHQFAKFYNNKYCLCVADFEISSSGKKNYI